MRLVLLVDIYFHLEGYVVNAVNNLKELQVRKEGALFTSDSVHSAAKTAVMRWLQSRRGVDLIKVIESKN